MVFGVSEQCATDYGMTIAYYTDVFNGPPLDIVWESTPELKSQMRGTLLRYVNMYRLAAMYSMKAVNPNFLKPDPNAPIKTETIKITEGEDEDKVKKLKKKNKKLKKKLRENKAKRDKDKKKKNNWID